MEENAVRLVKFLSERGVASRRAAGEIVRAGRVSVNGVAVTEPGFRVGPGDCVSLDGKVLPEAEKKVYILLNKPRGYVCSASDRHAEKLARGLLTGVDKRVFSAGRLDKESEGMLIFSNDGAYVERLSHPRYEVSKVYEVRTKRPIAKRFFADFVRGMEDEGELLRVLSLEEKGNRLYFFRLNEGKKREIRRLCALADAPVERLKRVRIGDLPLGELPAGEYRFLSEEEVKLSIRKGD